MTAQTPEERLAERGLSVPDVVPPVASYVPAVRVGQLVYTAGQLPMRGGALMATGKVGAEVAPEAATECAEQCALNALAAIKSVVGSLEGVRIVKVVAFVASTPCELALVPAEDLLGLDEQPNLPGTMDEHPNWRGRLPPDPLSQPAAARRIGLLAAARPKDDP